MGSESAVIFEKPGPTKPPLSRDEDTNHLHFAAAISLVPNAVAAGEKKAAGDGSKAK